MLLEVFLGGFVFILIGRKFVEKFEKCPENLFFDIEIRLRSDLAFILHALIIFLPPQELVKKIDEHFKYYWKHDRLSSLTQDDEYLQIMPKPLKYNLINYLGKGWS